MVIHRSLLYGDCFFETIAVRNGLVEHLALHHQRVLNSLKLFKMDTDYSQNEFEKEIHDTLQSLDNARVRIVFYRDAEGFYLPSENSFNTEITVTPLPEETRIASTAGIYSDHLKPITAFSSLKNPYSYLSVQASIFSKKAGWSDAILLNTNGRICESISGNIFLIRSGVIYTPSASEGCILGVMRSVVIDQLKQSGISCVEKQITIEELHQADEIFFTNCIHRITTIQEIYGKKLNHIITDNIRSLVCQDL